MVKVVSEVKPENLKHHFVFLERVGKDGNPEYGSGEYLVVTASQNVLYVSKPVVGYGFGDSYSSDAKAVVGTNPWTVVNAVYDRERVLSLARENYIWGKQGGKQWIESVYVGVLAKATELLRGLGEPFPKVEEVSDIEKTIISGRAEILLSKKMRSLISKTGCQSENVKAIVERIFFELGQ